MPDIFVDEPTKKDEVKEEKTDTPKKDSDKSASEKHSHPHLFASYCDNPTGTTFADKLEDEDILLFLRKHFVTNIPWIIKATILVLIPFVFFVIQSLGLIALDFLPSNYQVLILVFYYLLVWGYIFVNYITWFYNIGLVTNKRIIDIDFSSVVFENVAATKLSQVEDVSYSQVGVIRSIFDYGDVLIQTAASKDEFEFLAVPHPERVIKVINSLIGAQSDV